MNSVEPTSSSPSNPTVTEDGTQKDESGVHDAVAIEPVATAVAKQHLGDHGQNRVVIVLKGKDRLDGQKLYMQRPPLSHWC